MRINELDYANRSILEMESAQTLDDYERYWTDFLGYIAKFWNKYQNLHKTGEIISEVNHCRKNDLLLQYIEQARNSNEHTVCHIVTRTNGFTTITGANGGGTILRGSIRGNGEADIQVEGSLIVQFNPAHVEIVDVTNRGVTYPVPLNHLGVASEFGQ